MAELPVGLPLTKDGTLPNPDVSKGFSAYVHIPFCKVRCGYCDFNTYTNLELGPGASVTDFAESVLKEITFSAQVLARSGQKPGKLRSVFFGGGTPTMLSSSDLACVLQGLQDAFGIEEGAEITTEANPETLTKESLALLQAAGFNRISLGMQSAVPKILDILDRVHSAGQVAQVVAWCKELGLDFSLDLIYGTPGENMEQWQASLQAAIDLAPGHISCYALTIEEGTRMGAQLARGEIADPDADDLADKYLIAEQMLNAAGYQWYEISNWAKTGKHSRHNMAYWQNQNWWGYGPGAHSHINGTRFWNVKHPREYAQRLSAGHTPAHGHEVLEYVQQREEHIMLGIRLRQGIAIPPNTPAQTLTQLVLDGLLEKESLARGRLVLTLQGRLLADRVIRELW